MVVVVISNESTVDRNHTKHYDTYGRQGMYAAVQGYVPPLHIIFIDTTLPKYMIRWWCVSVWGGGGAAQGRAGGGSRYMYGYQILICVIS